MDNMYFLLYVLSHIIYCYCIGQIHYKEIIMQKKLLSLAIASVLSTGFIASSSVLAEEKAQTAPPPSTQAAPETAQTVESKSGFNIVYQSDKKAVDKEYLPFGDVNVLAKNIMRFIIDNAKVKKPTVTTIFPVFEKELAGGLEKKLFIEVAANTADTGVTTGTVHSPVVEAEITKKEGTLNWKGLAGTFDFAQDSTEINTDLKAKGLVLTKGKDKLTVSHLDFKGVVNNQFVPLEGVLDFPSVTFKAQKDDINFALLGTKATATRSKASSGVTLTDSNFHIDSASLSSEGDTFSLETLNVTTANKDNKETIDTLVTLALKKLVLPKELMEGDDRTVSYHNNISVKNIDAAALLDIQNTLTELEKQNIASNMLGFALFGKLMELAPQLLAKSPEIAISNIALTTPKGNLVGDIQLAVDGSKPIDLKTPEPFIQALTGNAHITIDKTLLTLIISQGIYEDMKDEAADAKAQADLRKQAEQAAQQQIQGLVAQNLFTKQGNAYVLKAKLAQRKLMLNGKEMPLPF